MCLHLKTLCANQISMDKSSFPLRKKHFMFEFINPSPCKVECTVCVNFNFKEQTHYSEQREIS